MLRSSVFFLPADAGDDEGGEYDSPQTLLKTYEDTHLTCKLPAVTLVIYNSIITGTTKARKRARFTAYGLAGVGQESLHC